MRIIRNWSFQFTTACSQRVVDKWQMWNCCSVDCRWRVGIVKRYRHVYNIKYAFNHFVNYKHFWNYYFILIFNTYIFFYIYYSIFLCIFINLLQKSGSDLWWKYPEYATAPIQYTHVITEYRLKFLMHTKRAVS